MIIFVSLFFAKTVYAEKLIAENDKEIVYFFSYKSPSSHAMSNSFHAYKIVHTKFSLPGVIYKVPYAAEDLDNSFFQASVAYFMLQLDSKNNPQSSIENISSLELKMYELFKQLDITTKDQLVGLIGSYVLVAGDNAYLSMLYEDAAVYARQSALMQQDACVRLPCARIAGNDTVKVVLFNSSLESIKEFWENVTLSLAVVD